MSTANPVSDRVYAIIRREMPVSEDRAISPNDRIGADLGADSLDVIELVIALEKEFSIDLSDDTCDKIAAGTCADLVQTVMEATP
jgi:acyl carrier protein